MNNSSKLFSKIKISFFIFLLAFSFLGFYQKSSAALFQYSYGADDMGRADWGGDCIFWNVTLDHTIYVPGENIRVDGATTNNGCTYDYAWTNVRQTIHNAGFNALSSFGDIGTQYINIPANTASGTHKVVLNTYYEYDKYLYNDIYSPAFCDPGWYCNCGFKYNCANVFGATICTGWGCDWCAGKCYERARISHSTYAVVWGDGGDIRREIPITVIRPVVTLTASSGTDINNPLDPKSTTTISWTSTDLDRMEITLNGKPWKASYTTAVPTQVNHPATYSEPICTKGVCTTPVELTPAYTTTEPVNTFIPWTSGSTTTSPLIGGDNVFEFKGYVNGRNTPVVTKTLHVYVTTNININITSDKSVVTSGFPAKLTWSTVRADSCLLTRNGATWIADSATATSGVNVSTGNLTATTTFTVFCINRSSEDGSVVNSAEKSITIGVKPGVRPELELDVFEDEILWEVVGDVYSCALTNETTDETISTSLVGEMSYPSMTPETVIQLSCNTPFGVITSSSRSQSAVADSICKVTQAGGATDLYVNRKTDFEMVNTNGILSNVKWTFVNNRTTNAEGKIVSRVFTTVGTTTVTAKAKLTTPLGDISYSLCTGVLRFKLDPGVGSGEI